MNKLKKSLNSSFTSSSSRFSQQSKQTIVFRNEEYLDDANVQEALIRDYFFDRTGCSEEQLMMSIEYH